MGVARSDAGHWDSVFAYEVIRGSGVKVFNTESEDGELRAFQGEVEVLIPNWVETVVFDCSGPGLGYISWNAVNLKSYIRINDVGSLWVGLWKVLSTDYSNMHVDFNISALSGIWKVAR